MCVFWGTSGYCGPGKTGKETQESSPPSIVKIPGDTSKGQPPPSKLPAVSSWDEYVQEGWDSPFGLDYIFALDPNYRNPQLSHDFGKVVGVRWVNFARIMWSTIEKRPPRGGEHNYDWSGLDEAVRQWQKYGVHIFMSLRFRSPWATARIRNDVFVYLKRIPKWLAKRTADFLPKPEYMQDFRDFVFNLVERYDGDGIKDMPGLRFPVLHYQLGNEFYNELFWAGSVEEYIVLMKEGFRAARRANKNVKIVLPGVGFGTVYGFYGVKKDPLTKAYIDRQEQKIPSGMNQMIRRTEAFSEDSMKLCDFYDILDARWPNYGVIARCRELLDQFGCPEKEIWSGEIYSFFPLPDHLLLPSWSLQPYPAPSRSLEYIKILKIPKNPKFAFVNAWYRGMQAAQVVKECMVALDAGSKKLMMGWAVDVQSRLSPYPLAFSGLLSATFKKLWPAGYTYKLVIEKLDGMKSIRRLAMPENIYVYECIVRDDKKILVAFYDDHIGQNHDEPVGTTQAEIPFRGKHAKLTHIITTIDETEPAVEKVEVVDRKIRLTLNEYPVFLETLP